MQPRTAPAGLAHMPPILALLALLRCLLEPPPEPVRLVRVLDGDTIVVERRTPHSGFETVRVLFVDTEERITRRPPRSPSRPATVFGEETALWLAAELAGATELVLRFPPRSERRDPFGRLLAEVRLPDGRDLAHTLVEAGRSPYYVKYGTSPSADASLRQAQDRARSARRGVWDPRTNRPRSFGRPAARRPYDRLVPWWELRAAARRRFHERATSKAILPAWDPAALLRAVSDGDGTRCEVFGEVASVDAPDGGAIEVRLHGRDSERVLTWRFPAELRGEGERSARARDGTNVAEALARTRWEFHQNYVTLRGDLHRRGSAFLMVASRTTDWCVGPPAEGLESRRASASACPRFEHAPPPRRGLDMPSEPTEIELKFAVEGEEAFDALVRHLDLPSREFHKTLDQVNHFFDTPSFALHAAKVTLRLREENRRHLLTLKGPERRRSADGVATERIEVEVRLAPERALDVLQGTLSPRDALAQRLGEEHHQALELLDEHLGGAELHYAGRFETRRTRLSPVAIEIDGSPVELVFELDRVVFGKDRIDHEIEVEVTREVNAESVAKTLGAMLGEAGIAWVPALSKAHRFFELARD